MKERRELLSKVNVPEVDLFELFEVDFAEGGFFLVDFVGGDRVD